jgi:hypothetical protein
MEVFKRKLSTVGVPCANQTRGVVSWSIAFTFAKGKALAIKVLRSVMHIRDTLSLPCRRGAQNYLRDFDTVHKSPENSDSSTFNWDPLAE